MGSRRLAFARPFVRNGPPASAIPSDTTLVCARLDARLLGIHLLSIEAQVVAGQPGKALASDDMKRYGAGSKGRVINLAPEQLSAPGASADLDRALELFASNAKVLNDLDSAAVEG